MRLPACFRGLALHLPDTLILDMRKDLHRVVAIDGPAASGKSSVARELARRLGFAYVNSGAIYRAITWHVLQKAIDPSDAPSVGQALGSVKIACRLENADPRIFINDADPTDRLHEGRVNEAVSRVSRVPSVRAVVVQKMRDYARSHNLVIEGRDIGSVVFSDTPYKFILMLHLRCVCAAVPRKGSGTKLRCVTTPILHGLSHRSSSRGMHTSLIRPISRSIRSSVKLLNN